MKKVFIKWLSLCAFTLSPAAFAEDKPNIVLILTDDQGYGDISSHGNRMIDTPHLDQLAEDGTRFENFFVSNVCAPTRASLLTGRYHIRTGVVQVSRGLEIMRSEEVTIAEVFKAQGYETGLFGKWHNGEHYPNNPLGQGFDEYFGFCAGHIGNFFDATLDHNKTLVKTKGFITDVLTDKALNWIERHQDKPFFAYIPYNAPHAPYQVEDKYYDKFAVKGYHAAHSAAYGMIENLDDNIGRLLKKLDDLKLTDNTIVIFLTDNGPNSQTRFNGGMKGSKGSVDEGGVRVPFFIRWPGKIAKGRTIHDLAAHIDVLPTLMELAGINVDLPNKLDGRSLTSLISSSKKPKSPAWPERMIFTHGPGRNMTPDSGPGAVRSNQYRYVLSRGEEGLYDMINDPGQEKDLKKSKKKIFDELKAAYIAWFKDVSAGWEPNTIIPVGYKEFPATYLQAVEAKLEGKLKFNGRGFAHDWIVNWTNPNDKITWDINVIISGRYKVYLDYVVPESDVGATIKISTGKASIRSKIIRAFDPELFPAHDRSKRAGELEKPWKKITLGEMDIDTGNAQVILSADTMTGKQVIEVRRVTLELISSNSGL